jgi:thymidine kinase
MANRGFVYNWGTMGSGKTWELMKIRHNRLITGKKVVLAKHSMDLKASDAIETKVEFIDNVPVDVIIRDEDEPYEKILRTLGISSLKSAGITCAFFDEVQFMSPAQVNDIDANIVRYEGIEVQAFGLKTDFIGEIFPGTAQAFARADEVREIRGIQCECSADTEPIFNFRYMPDGTPIFSGNQVSIDGIDSLYKPLCRSCYFDQLVNAKNAGLEIDSRLVPMLKVALKQAGVVTTTDK